MIENQKKIWITGASSGIGKAVAEKFAAEGWKVAVSARRRELLDELAKNQNIKSFPMDVTDRSQIKNVFKNILNDFGGLDICLFSSGTYEPKDEQNIDADKIKNDLIAIDLLINNAGVVNTEYSETIDGIENTFAVNHLGYFLFTNLLLDLVKKESESRIINVSSAAHHFVK